MDVQAVGFGWYNSREQVLSECKKVKDEKWKSHTMRLVAMRTDMK